MLVSSTTTGKGIQSQEEKVGVPVHCCEYAHDEGKGIRRYKGKGRDGSPPTPEGDGGGKWKRRDVIE
jgi:hypothetical protein